MAFSSKAQEPKRIFINIPTLQSSIIDTGSRRLKWYPEITTQIPRSEYPLLVINGKQFKYSGFSNLYFDTSNISSFNAISSKNNSCKLYDKAGENGIIIINTKHNIDWISSTQIFRQHSKSLFHFIKINGSLVDPIDKIYIQKNLIKSITVDNIMLIILSYCLP